MSGQVRVLLLEDIESLGKAGEIVSVSEGYARNFLFPEGKAALATESVEKQQAVRRQADRAQEQATRAVWQQQAEQLMGTELTMTRRVKEGDEIYGSIGAREIAKQLNAQAHLNLKAKDVVLPEVLTRLGTYDATVRLSPDIETTIKVTVLADPGSLPKTEDDE